VLNKWLLGYLVVFGLGNAFLFLGAFLLPKEDRDPPLETLVDFFVASTLFAGMLLLLVDIDSPTVRMLWKPVSIVVAVAAVYANLRARFKELRDQESAEEHGAIAFADCLTITLFLPSIAFNIYFAFWR